MRGSGRLIGGKLGAVAGYVGQEQVLQVVIAKFDGQVEWIELECEHG